MRRRRVLALLASAVGASCGSRLAVDPVGTVAPPTDPGAPESLATMMRSGRIRFGFNLTSLEFVGYTHARLSGIAWDLAEAFSKDLRISIDPVLFSGVQVGWDTGRRGDWDTWLTWRDSSAQGFAFTNPVVVMQWAYLVPARSPVRGATDLDRPGVRVAVPMRGPIVDHLSATLTHAGVVRTSGPDEMKRLLEIGSVDVVGASRVVAEQLSAFFDGGRVFLDPVLLSAHALAVVAGRTDLLSRANTWVEGAKSSGLITSILVRNGVPGILTAAAGP